jgi:hypothetical protein
MMHEKRYSKWNKKRLKFIQRHKRLCISAFAPLASMQCGHGTEPGKKLIAAARKELGYSPKYTPVDLYCSLNALYKRSQKTKIK